MNPRKPRQQGLGAALGAREALEAAFRREMTPQFPAQVVIKRRRVAGPEEATASEPPLAQQPAPQAAPRVHRLQRSTTDPLSNETAAERESASPDATTSIGPERTVRPRRPRRHLHGAVTTVYRAPPITAPVAEVPATEPGSVPQHRRRDSAVLPQLPMAGLIQPSAELRKLLAQIARLEAQAEQARRREVVRAVAWIKAAIQDYGIEAADVGL